MIPSLLIATVASLVNGLMLLLSYITNNSTFPPPLNEREEKEYLQKMLNGEEEARNVLIERNLRLVAHIVKKFESSGEDMEDLISIGTIGLIKGINTFDQSKNFRLATYAAKCIENEILMHLRSARRGKSDIFLYDSIGNDREGNEITLIDVLGTDGEIVFEVVENKLEQKRLQQKMEKLRGKEKKVLEMRYGIRDGIQKTQREIAKILGISRSYVSRIEKKALNKLFKEMFAEGYR